MCSVRICVHGMQINRLHSDGIGPFDGSSEGLRQLRLRTADGNGLGGLVRRR